jgi:ABC-type antimicrobial peptide transport system permease subunit
MSAVRRIISDGYAAATMDQVELRTMVRERFLRERLLAWVSGFFGILAVALATIGFYGVVSHMAARRQNEIGIRIALGAGRRDVVGLLLRNVAALFAIGVPLGLLGSLALARGVSTLLYDIQPGDPLALGLAAAALTITGVVATLIPSARASRLDPGKCLRAD